MRLKSQGLEMYLMKLNGILISYFWNKPKGDLMNFIYVLNVACSYTLYRNHV
jgi:hypothetical protein